MGQLSNEQLAPLALTAREMVRRLVPRTLGLLDTPGYATRAAQMACERVYRATARQFGSTSARALVTRALAQAQTAHPLLADVHLERRHDFGLDGVARLVLEHGDMAVAAALEASLEKLIGLVERLLGPDVVARLQQDDHRGLHSAALQHDVVERLLLTALREQAGADAAEMSRRDATYLAAESERLVTSLDEGTTLAAIARLSLPHLGGWCIVDTVDDVGTMHRMTMVHPSPDKQTMLDGIGDRWVPRHGDAFGVAAMLRTGGSEVIVTDARTALAGGDQIPELMSLFGNLDVATLLTIPLIVRYRVVGAITYVGERDFTPDDLVLAGELAQRSATALDRARLYGEAIARQARAESSTQMKSTLLGTMSHEVRTPLNAIAGYVELLDMEIHGPVTPAQRKDLDRIRSSQQYLTRIVTDLMSFTKFAAGVVRYDVRDLLAVDLIMASLALVEGDMRKKGLTRRAVSCDPAIVVTGDRDPTIRILVNLLANAIKFTPAGGYVGIECAVSDQTAFFCVSDTGVGVASDMLETIFDPFVQIKRGATSNDAGIGLGLSISRGIARDLNGDVTAESVVGEGARFTLSLPRSRQTSMTTSIA